MIKQWEAVRTPPEEALKKITGGRLKGMTDIKPQFRYQVMTEVYGLCGIGWKYELVDRWLEDGSEGQKVAFAEVNLFIKVDGEWSDAIPGTGGSMLITKESAGLHTNDECYKMAMTDALSVAMTKIGVASDIYMGLWDGSKYKDKPPEKRQDAPRPTKTPDPAHTSEGERIAALKVKLGKKMAEMSNSEKKEFYGWFITDKKETPIVLQGFIDNYDQLLSSYVVSQEATA